MKLTIDAAALREALALSVAAKNSPLLIMEHVLIESMGINEAGTLRLVTQNAMEELTVSVRCFNEVSGETTVSVNDLRNALSGLTGEVSLEFEHGTLFIRQEAHKARRSFRFNTMDAADFPRYQGDNAVEFRIDPDTLAHAVARVKYAAAKNDLSRPYLNGVYVSADFIGATDGLRMAVYAHNEKIEHRLVIPASSVDRLLKTLNMDDGYKALKLYLSIDEKPVALSVETESVVHIVRLIEFNGYPDLLNVLPKGKPAVVAEFNAADFLPILDRCISLEPAQVGKRMASQLAFEFERQMVHIRGNHTDDFAEMNASNEGSVVMVGNDIKDVLLLNKQEDVTWSVFKNAPSTFSFGGADTHVIQECKV